MSNPDYSRWVRVLTGSDETRDVVQPNLGTTSDTALILRINPKLDSRELDILSRLANILRLMDSLITGSEPSSEFVKEFSRLWLQLDGDYDTFPEGLDRSLDQLEELYEDAQLFSERPAAPDETPYLLNAAELRERTAAVYAELLSVWEEVVLRRRGG